MAATINYSNSGLSQIHFATSISNKSPSLSLLSQSPPLANKKPLITFCCHYSPSTNVTFEPKPVFAAVRSSAPITVANLGCGFDSLGVAVDGFGDMVTARVDANVCPGKISISEISGPFAFTKLSKDPFLNPAGVAAMAVINRLNIQSVGISLSIEKNILSDSGLGSDASSAAASAFSVNELFGNVLSVEELVLAGLESEFRFSGYHADNIAPALMGGFILVQNTRPLDLKKLSFPARKDLFFVLVVPELQLPARKMREVLPPEIGLGQCGWNCSQAGALVAAVLEGDVKGLGKAMSADKIIEPRRAPFIPGMAAVKKAAIEAGAFGCTISGSGPAMVAVVEDKRIGKEVGMSMVEAFSEEGNLKADFFLTRLDRVGARRVSSVPRGWW